MTDHSSFVVGIRPCVVGRLVSGVVGLSECVLECLAESLSLLVIGELASRLRGGARGRPSPGATGAARRDKDLRVGRLRPALQADGKVDPAGVVALEDELVLVPRLDVGVVCDPPLLK